MWSLFWGDNLLKPRIAVASDPLSTVISAQTRLSSHTVWQTAGSPLKPAWLYQPLRQTASMRRLATGEESSRRGFRDAEDGVALIFRSGWRFCACAINVKSSMCSETTKHFRYKCHEPFVKFPVMITVKSFLKCRSMQYNIAFFINHCHGLWRTTVTWFTLAIKICLKTCLPRVNLRQITLLRGYIHPTEQPVVFRL